MYPNPHGVTPDQDRIHEVPPENPTWTENINLASHSGHHDQGVYLHLGRMRSDQHLWEGAFAAFLPGQELLLSRTFGRAQSSSQASSGALTWTVTEPNEKWSAHFDGAARRVGRTIPAAGFVPDGPIEPVQMELQLTAAGPVWSAGRAMTGSELRQSWAHLHLQQPLRVRGEIRTATGVIPVDHIAVRDHSVGSRDYSQLRGDNWATCPFPDGRILSTVQVWQLGDYQPVSHGFLFDGETMHELTDIDSEPVQSTLADPQDFWVEFTGPNGRERVTARMQHSTVFTLDEPLGMPLGTNHHGVITTQGPARYEWDGMQALGWVERTNRLAEMLHARH